jgi:hypothetical protein
MADVFTTVDPNRHLMFEFTVMSEPKTVTMVPPAMWPLLGQTLVILIGSTNANFKDPSQRKPAFPNMTSTTELEATAGLVHKASEDDNTIDDTLVEEKKHDDPTDPGEKPDPNTEATQPPTVGPEIGVI